MSFRFESPPPLPRWLEDELPFQRRAVRRNGLRIHFIDHGHGPVIALFHGNPTWCFLWRKILPHLVRAGFRVIAPDLIGFGLSDKPARVRSHLLAEHIAALDDLLTAVAPRKLTLVGQDWGGPIAAGLAARRPDRVQGLVFGNTAVLRPRRPLTPKLFHRFSQLPLISDLAFRGLLFPIPVLDRVQGDRQSLSRRERRAYAHPFRRVLDRAGPLGLARMVPDREDHPSTALVDTIGTYVESYRGPVGLIWGKNDPILGRALDRHRRALQQARVVETEAGHFLQEEVPEEFAELIQTIASS